MTVTSPVGDPPGLRLRALTDFLADHVPDLDPGRPLAADLLAGGRSNVTYRVSQGERSWVVRRPPLGHVMPTAHDMAREYRVLRGLHGSGVPVPETFALCEDTDVIGVPFMVMEYVPGRTYAAAEDVAGLPAERARLVSTGLVDVLLRLHAVDPVGVGLQDLGRPQGFLARQVRRWRGQWDLTSTASRPEIDTLTTWLTGRVADLPDAPGSVVHGDVRVDNVIFDADTGQARAVLDWEMSTLGDPVADLALLLVYWTRPGDRLRADVPVALGVTDGPGFLTREQIVERYTAERAVDDQHLRTCVVLACLKLAVIMESIHHRASLGAHLGADASAMGAAAPALLRMGLAVMETPGLSGLSA